MKSTSDISLGVMLSVIYKIDKKHFGSQVLFYSIIWRSYHRMRSESELIEWMTCQSIVNEIMRSVHDLPDEQYRFYVEDDEHLREDVDCYIREVIKTNRQYKEHHEQMLSLVVNSNNLDPKDKQYILDYIYVPTDMQLFELMFRMLYVLIQEPNDRRKFQKKGC